MTRAELIHLKYALRSLRASITGLGEAIPRARHPDLLQLELHRLKASEAELVRRVDAERAAIDAPHAFVLNPRLPPRVARLWAGAVALIQHSAQAAAEIQVHVVETKDGTKVPVAFLPDGNGAYGVASLGAAAVEGAKAARELRLLSATGPDRREGTANHQALGSFIEHVNRFRAERSALWADEARRALVAVFDYHAPGDEGAPGWGRHRSVYPCPLSEAWCAWGGLGGLNLTQEHFAELLDRRDRELVAGTFRGGALEGKLAPSPAELVTLASNLETYSTAKVKKERDPQTQRVKLTFTEEAGVSVAPPAAFLVNIPVFTDSALQQLEVRLRVTVEDGGKAKFQLRIHAAGDVLREAFENLAEHAAADTKVPLFIGTPEA